MGQIKEPKGVYLIIGPSVLSEQDRKMIGDIITTYKTKIIIPLTGRAYEPGNDVPTGWRDPRYVGPEENGQPADNPARYLPPRQILMGVSFKF